MTGKRKLPAKPSAKVRALIERLGWKPGQVQILERPGKRR